MNRKEQLERYLEEMGAESFARQVIAAENRYPCCGQYRVEGHHPDCRRNPARKIERAYRKLHGDGVN